MDDNPRQFIDELKFAIVRRRVGQIALAVVLAEECIRFLSALVWYLIIPTISNILDGRSESVMFQSQQHRSLPWIQLLGAILEFVVAVVFVFYVNRWLYGRNRPRTRDEVQDLPPDQPNQEQPSERDVEYEPIVPRLFSAPEAPKPELVSSRAKDHPPDEN
ncbi:MAG TPA: MscL family protein [Candidatus Sulfotelmatobacter sp.]|nr:MscL family protein [Candidatus Sulfotelmatobacter sp.]